MIEDLLTEAEMKMEQAVEHVASEFATVRTGRANPQILKRITADYYGQPTPLLQLASVSVPEPRLLVVTPFDPNSLSDIERAIGQSDLGLNPNSDGQVIRIAFPPLTEERRLELVKMVRHMAEDGRVAVRNIRRNAKGDIEALHGEISDDDIRRAEKELQDLTDKYVGQIDALLEEKEVELREV
ncbi:MAG TPA: ribosome recycling factor [Acidimicrobiia bacterium]|jgi:ribosome recycling factor|nr:ribosome recycling factor [Acidimicrobiia bacterium]